jgi:hypothetical protein
MMTPCIGTVVELRENARIVPEALISHRAQSATQKVDQRVGCGMENHCMSSYEMASTCVFLTHKQSSATLQPGLNDVASIVPVTVASWGGTQRKVPMGAAAYGMPLNEATPSEHTPCTSSPRLPGRATTQLADSSTRARSARPTARMSTLTSTVIMTRTVSRRGRVPCVVSFAFRVSLCVCARLLGDGAFLHDCVTSSDRPDSSVETLAQTQGESCMTQCMAQ